MSTERFQQVMSLFDRARALRDSQRSAFLDEHCADRPDVRAELEALLAADSRTAPRVSRTGGGALLLAARLRDESGSESHVSDERQSVPTLAGHYRILRVIGEGGMGIVYEAQQTAPRRTVALKAIRPGLLSPQILRRFQHEIEILGRLQHPGIAQIYEAGAADAERPDQAYFAMEYVAGEPLTTFAARRDLPAPRRIELLIKVCDAVEHAHQRGVIHRDLKPANILVQEETKRRRDEETEREAPGAPSLRLSVSPSLPAQPKILDFGVARLVDPDPHMTAHTLSGQMVGTLAYMSPEQIAGDSLEVDTRTDVYALGVLLYELLSGRQPHDLSRLSVPEMGRVIRDVAPPPLGALDSNLRGDLELIVETALAKDKERRYSSPAALAADLRRFLRGEPIEARAPEALYLLRKLIARNRGVALAAALSVLFLVVGVVGTSWQAVRATGQQRRAEAAEAAAVKDAHRARVEAEKADRVSSFFRQMLAAANPNVAQGREVSVREILDHAAARVQTELLDVPEVEAAVRDTIGDTYRSLALYEPAESHLRAAVELRRNTSGIHPLDLAASLHNLAEAIHSKGNSNDAYQYADEALKLRRQHLGNAHQQVAQSLHLVARISLKTGHHDWAEAAYREELSIRADRLKVRDDGLAWCLSRFGTLLLETYRFAEAERLQTQALALARELHGDEHPLTAAVATNVGCLLAGVGRYAEAEPVLRAALAGARRFWGDDHPDTVRLLLTLPRVLHGLGRNTEAEPLVRQGLAAWERKFTRQHRTTAEFLVLMAQILIAKDGAAGAEEAERIAREAVESMSAHRTWLTWEAESVLGSCLAARGRFAEAEPLLLTSYGELKVAKGAGHRRTLDALERIVALYTAWGKLEAAGEYGSRLPTGTTR